MLLVEHFTIGPGRAEAVVITDQSPLHFLRDVRMELALNCFLQILFKYFFCSWVVVVVEGGGSGVVCVLLLLIYLKVKQCLAYLELKRILLPHTFLQQQNIYYLCNISISYSVCM